MPQARTPYWALTVYIGLGAVSLALALHGFVNGLPEFGVGGMLGLIIVGALAPIGLRPAGGSASDPRLHELLLAIREQSELGALSDDARRVMNRQRERDLLRRAIEEDIQSHDYEAAMILVKELAERFGYRADAEEFRHRIETSRFQTQQHKIASDISRLDRIIQDRDWDEAMAEAARITRLYPESDRVSGLRHRVETARQRHKEELERRFLRAADEEDTTEALQLLKELDQYLTEEEAEPFQEVARGVVGKARENLGVKFKLAVKDKRWSEAADVGQKIIDEFPNTRMAEEIRGAIDGIRARATGVTAQG
ncbi:MAG: hypothetical protein ACF8Q5_04445 [Phycisphaerales bacterium JB040]